MIFRKFMPYLLADLQAGNAVSMVSPSGYGKTSFCKALKKHVQKLHPGKRVGFQMILCPTLNPTSVFGPMFKGTGEYNGKHYTVVDPAMPLWMVSDEGIPAWAYDIFIIVFDEYGQGDPEVKKPLANVFLNGELPPCWRLPKENYRIACSNKGTGYGVTREFYFTVSRLSEYHIQKDIQSLLEWMEFPYEHKGETWCVSPWMRVWAEKNPDVIFEKEPDEVTQWCNPRSAMAADRFLQRMFPDGRVDHNDPYVVEGIKAKVGKAGQASITSWLTYTMDLPQVEDVWKDPEGTAVPDRPDLKLLMAYEVAYRCDSGTIRPAMKYMARFPKDMMVTFVRAAVCRDPAQIGGSPQVQEWASRPNNSALLALMTQLAG